ncbi:hypothetical protein JOF47_003750 [Paeniglutamicibacter kerguelensis]|uniref:Transposase n=1 Tax=Paeniglutamicibacter kerguelensis TaxID=254788 RepID=A0ABS4XKM5_9MICC|nr:hypothetical protein [Paeniglutamicibacter kerguelensis]
MDQELELEQKSRYLQEAPGTVLQAEIMAARNKPN